MKASEIPGAIGCACTVNGYGDLGIDVALRRIIGKEVKLIKQCKSGLLQVEREGKKYSVPASNVNVGRPLTKHIIIRVPQGITPTALETLFKRVTQDTQVCHDAKNFLITSIVSRVRWDFKMPWDTLRVVRTIEVGLEGWADTPEQKPPTAQCLICYINGKDYADGVVNIDDQMVKLQHGEALFFHNPKKLWIDPVYQGEVSFMQVHID